MPVNKNEKYGKLIIIRAIGSNKHKSKMWECLCDCGNTIKLSTNVLTSGNTKSCGCLHAKSMKAMGIKRRKLNRYDLTGKYGVGHTSKNEEFYFDLEDYNKIKIYTWSYNQDGYVFTQPFGKIIRMHMLIMDSDGSLDIDHRNHIVHDNRKENLRFCEHYENIIHTKTYSNNTSGRKGVCWDKNRNKWIALITYNKKNLHLGRFDNFEDAVKAREEAEIKYHKEFICDK